MVQRKRKMVGVRKRKKKGGLAHVEICLLDIIKN